MGNRVSGRPFLSICLLYFITRKYAHGNLIRETVRWNQSYFQAIATPTVGQRYFCTLAGFNELLYSAKA